jgi:hypothetical protein
MHLDIWLRNCTVNASVHFVLKDHFGTILFMFFQSYLLAVSVRCARDSSYRIKVTFFNISSS